MFEWFDIEAAPRDWDVMVQKHGQNVFHRAEMLAAHQYGMMVRRGIVVTDGGTAIGVVGGLMVRGRQGQRFESLSFPALGPGVRGGIPRELVQWLQAEGCAGGRIGSFGGGVEDGDTIEGFGRPAERLEFIWDLRAGEERWLGALRTQHRRNLKKAMALPMEFREIIRNRAWVLTRLRDAWERRKGREAGWIGLWRSYAYHRRLETWLGRTGIGRLYGLFGTQDTPLSIAYMLEDGQSSFYMLGASSREGYETAASVRLFWELARRYHASSVERLNLGGVPAEAVADGHEEHGVYRFKAAYGLEPVVRRTLNF